jgi:hypothetical protein
VQLFLDFKKPVMQHPLHGKWEMAPPPDQAKTLKPNPPRRTSGAASKRPLEVGLDYVTSGDSHHTLDLSNSDKNCTFEFYMKNKQKSET